jgi:AcrR family transcriptional regulator
MISDPQDRAVPKEERRTPRQEKRAQTRAALLDAAERLWAKHGIRGASLDEIAAQAGMTKGAVYSNFTGKTDLILALLDRYTQLELGPPASSTLRDTDRPRADRCADAGRHYARRLSAEETRMKALLLMELWLFGMRDFSAGWRIADWYQTHREGLAAGLQTSADDKATSNGTSANGINGDGSKKTSGDKASGDDLSAEDRASLAMALEFGLALQHLLDPDRVPAELYGPGMNLVLGPALP